MSNRACFGDGDVDELLKSRFEEPPGNIIRKFGIAGEVGFVWLHSTSESSLWPPCTEIIPPKVNIEAMSLMLLQPTWMASIKLLWPDLVPLHEMCLATLATMDKFRWQTSGICSPKTPSNLSG